MRYILFILSILISQIANAQINQPGLRDYQITGATLDDNTLFILGTDTSGAKIGLGKFYHGDSLISSFCDPDYDWIKYGTASTVPNNTDTMYHMGIATIGDDSVYTGTLNVKGRLDARYPESSSNNVAIGRSAGNLSATNLDANTSFGYYAGAGLANTTAANVNIGAYSGQTLLGSNYNVGIGAYTLDSIRSGANYTVAIGYGALQKIRGSSSTQNIGIGYNAINTLKGNLNLGNIAIGGSAMATLSGSRNIAIGQGALTSLDGSNNTVIGYGSFATNTAGSGNVSLGYQSGANETGSNKLYIENSNSTTPLIKGDFSADTLRINGSLSVRDITTGSSTDNTLGWNSSTKKVTIKDADYLVYTALITQTGTSAPTATVLKNTLGGTVVWSYNGVGDYTATLSGVFTANKTTVTALSNNISTAKEASGVWDTTSTIDVYTTDAWDSANDVLNISFFEIRVYP